MAENDVTYDWDKLEDLKLEAQGKLLEVIIQMAPRTTGSPALLRLAEAYAYVVAPNNAHGGVTDPS